MSFTTYSELKTELQAYLARSDSTLTNRIDTFIDLTEDLLNSRLRHPIMIESYDITTASGTSEYELPNDYLEMVAIKSSGPTFKDLDAIDQSRANSTFYGYSTGIPTAYRFTQDNNIQFFPAPDGVYTITVEYYEKLPALSDDVTTNNVLDRFPTLYFYGAMMMGYEFLRDDERLAIYTERFTSALDVANRQGNKQVAGATLQMRPRVVV